MNACGVLWVMIGFAKLWCAFGTVWGNKRSYHNVRRSRIHNFKLITFSFLRRNPLSAMICFASLCVALQKSQNQRPCVTHKSVLHKVVWEKRNTLRKKEDTGNCPFENIGFYLVIIQILSTMNACGVLWVMIGFAKLWCAFGTVWGNKRSYHNVRRSRIHNFKLITFSFLRRNPLSAMICFASLCVALQKSQNQRPCVTHSYVLHKVVFWLTWLA